MIIKVAVLLLITITLHSATSNKDFTLLDGKGVIMNEPTNTFSTKIKSSNTLGDNLVLTFPNTLPNNNQILVVNASGELSWSDNNATAGSDNQVVDKFILSGNQILLSLEDDGAGDYSIDLSSVTAFLKSADIVNNLTSTDTDKPLSANQGKELKTIVDALNSSLSNHISDTNNPHNVTKAQLSLENVDNTSDTNKPISTLTQTALNTKADKTTLTDINTTLSSKIDDINSTQSDNQGVDILDFNGTHLTISLDNNDTNKTVALNRSLDSISDINTTNLTNGQVLKYDTNISQWIPHTLSVGTTIIDNLNSSQTNQALSANQGNILNTNINEINITTTSNQTNIATNLSNINSVDTRVDEVNQTVQTISSNQTTLDGKIDDVNSSVTTLNTTVTANKTDLTQQIIDVNSSITSNQTAINSRVDDLNSSTTTALNAKVAIADIIDTLTSVLIDKPLSANQGKILKALIDDVNSSLSTHTTTTTSNPHNVTKADVGLSDVNNISDLNKPISTATTTALDLKINISDIKNNLTSTDTNKPLSAKQGKELKDLIDSSSGASEIDGLSDAKSDGSSIFLGSNAGASDDKSDNRNVAIGGLALNTNISGGYNVASGHSALYNNISGNSNVANGYQALYSNTTGGMNIANGSGALRSNTTGYNNISNGSYALFYNTTGYRNTANGSEALRNNTIGYKNIANGYAALYSNTEGNNNIAIGYFAGRYMMDGSTANQLGNQNIFLGNDTKALADNDQNEIVIGYNATGEGNNSVVLGNDNITKTVLKGTVTVTAIDMQNNKITNLATPIDDNDSTNKAYVDLAVSGAGGGGFKIYNKNDVAFGYLIGYNDDQNVAMYVEINHHPSAFNPIRYLPYMVELTNTLYDNEVYFSGANCEGERYMASVTYNTFYRYGYGCTGSADCTTDKVLPYGNSGIVAYESYRNTSGECIASSNSSGERYPTFSASNHPLLVDDGGTYKSAWYIAP